MFKKLAQYTRSLRWLMAMAFGALSDAPVVSRVPCAEPSVRVQLMAGLGVYWGHHTVCVPGSTARPSTRLSPVPGVPIVVVLAPVTSALSTLPVLFTAPSVPQ